MTKTIKGNVYFVAAFGGKEKYGESYQAIAETFRDLGYEVWDAINNIDAEEAKSYTKAQITEYFKDIQRKIRKADLFVAEESVHSSAVGYEIGYAMGLNKPCLVLRRDTLSLSGAPLRGNPSKLLSYVRYGDKDLKKKIMQFEKKASKGIFVKRLPIEFTQNQVDYVQYRQTSGDRKKSFNSAIREIVDKTRYHDKKYHDTLEIENKD